MFCAIDHIGHLIRRFDGERMLGKTCARGDIARHFPSDPELSSGSLSEQRYDQVLQRNHTTPKVHQFDIRQFVGVSLSVSLGFVWIRTAFIVPPQKSRSNHQQQLNRGPWYL